MVFVMSVLPLFSGLLSTVISVLLLLLMHGYEHLGQFHTGVGNSPYINSLDFACDPLHVSGTYRQFFDYEGVNDPNLTAHKANAGLNGPENNYGLFYVYSDDLGETSHNSNGLVVASLRGDGRILPDADGLIVFDIPLNSGTLNQEPQYVDQKGGFHALNREYCVWIHYYRSPTGN
jgi:BNR repeat-containing family member